MICKIEDEEKRYAKAYGAGTLEFDQFKELMKETEKRKLIHKKQLEELSQKHSQASVKLQLDDIIAEVKKVLATLDLSNKVQIIKDIIDKVIIQEMSRIEVWAHLPLSSVLKLGYVTISRNCRITKCGEEHAV